jgi:tetratricopeptide (TPR) repeat protein
MVRCPTCGKQISEMAVMCYACGRKMRDEASPAPAPAKEAPKPLPKPAPPEEPQKEKELTKEEIAELEGRLAESRKATEKSPRDASEWFLQGSILTELKRYDEAIICYNRGIEIEPTSMTAWSAKAYAFNKIGRQKEAATCYKRSMEIGMARSSIDLDEMLQVVTESKSYKKALDRAIGVIQQAKPQPLSPRPAVRDVSKQAQKPQPSPQPAAAPKPQEPPQAEPAKDEGTDEQERCPQCKSFKVKFQADGSYKCMKCGNVF